MGMSEAREDRIVASDVTGVDASSIVEAGADEGTTEDLNAKLAEGIQQVKDGDTVDLGSFAKYADDEIDDDATDLASRGDLSEGDTEG